MITINSIISKCRFYIRRVICCRMKDDDVEWVVNDVAELGVKIGKQFFWLYKGRSLIYHDLTHDNGMPMYFRPVGKREFGECCHPLHLNELPDRYIEGSGWKRCDSI